MNDVLLPFMGMGTLLFMALNIGLITNPRPPKRIQIPALMGIWTFYLSTLSTAFWVLGWWMIVPLLWASLGVGLGSYFIVSRKDRSDPATAKSKLKFGTRRQS